MIKENYLTADREKRHIIHGGMKSRMTADFSLKTRKQQVWEGS